MSAFGGKADIALMQLECPLLAQSGHWQASQGTQGSSDARGSSMAPKIKFLTNKNKTRIPKRLN